MKKQLNGKIIAILLRSTDGEFSVFRGKVCIENNKIYFERAGGVKFLIYPEIQKRIKKVDTKLKDILLGAEYYVTINVKNISDNRVDNYLDTGLKWPKD